MLFFFYPQTEHTIFFLHGAPWCPTFFIEYSYYGPLFSFRRQDCFMRPFKKNVYFRLKVKEKKDTCTDFWRSRLVWPIKRKGSVLANRARHYIDYEGMYPCS